MTMQAHNPFWDFSVAVYARDGVAPACLRLQDRIGVDVNLLLYCFWVAYRGSVALDSDAIDRILSRVAPWKSDVVAPLRAIRRALKTACDGFDPDDQEALRSEIKRIELRSERLQQDVLAGAMDIPADAAAPMQTRRQAAMKNVDRYLDTLEMPVDGAARGDVVCIADAVFTFQMRFSGEIKTQKRITDFF